MPENKPTLTLKNIFFEKELICDNCEKKIVPRVDVAFKDLTYGVTFCLACRTQYLERILAKN